MLKSVYQLQDQHNSPFYIGVTNNPHRRLQEHLRTALTNPVWHVHRKINSITKSGGKVSLVIIQSDLIIEDAYNLEKELIASLTRSGIQLCNLTAGGDGGTGHSPIFTDEWRAKLRTSAKLRIERDGVNFKGKTHSEDTKLKMKQNSTKLSGNLNPFFGRNHSTELKQKFSSARTGIGLKQYNVTSPIGNTFFVTEGLNAFCKRINAEHNLSITSVGLSNVATGRYKTHKGWTASIVLPQSNN